MGELSLFESLVLMCLSGILVCQLQVTFGSTLVEIKKR